MFKYFKTSSVLGFERFWIWRKYGWTHLFSNSPHPHPPKIVLEPMSSLSPSFIRYQNISLFIKPNAWVFQYIFIFSSLRMQTAKFLNDSDRHSDFGRGDQKSDKNLTEDWYRFSAGAGMSIRTHCLPHHRCGTDMPGWMDGARPTVDEGVVSRKVCFNGYYNCCHHQIMINVRNCISFFVYRLKPVSICSCRYCGGS